MAKEKVSIIDQAGNFELKVKVSKMIDGVENGYAPHEVCDDCLTKVGRANRCTNEKCGKEFSSTNGNTVRNTFASLKNGESVEQDQTYSKAEIKACRAFAQEGIIIQAKIAKEDFDRTTVRDCHYVAMQDLTAKTKKAFANLYSGLLKGTHNLLCTSGRTLTEKRVILAVERIDGKDVMVLFTVAFALQRRPIPDNCSPVLEVDSAVTTKVIDFIERQPEPAEEVESQTRLNFEKLQNGEQIVELQHQDEEADADAMFDEAPAPTPKVKKGN